MRLDPAILGRIGFYEWAALISGWNDEQRRLQQRSGKPSGRVRALTTDQQVDMRRKALAAFGLSEGDIVN